MYLVLKIIFYGVTYLVTGLIFTVIGLMALHLILYLADANPFGKPARLVHRFTEPLLAPTKWRMRAFGIDPKFAPLVIILLTILLGYFAIQLVEAVVFPVAGMWWAITSKLPVPAVGYFIFGALSVYSWMLFMRIILSWVWSPYENRFMRFLVRATNPLLEPIRRLIPPFGAVDLSFFLAPMLAFFLITLLQNAVAATLLRNGAPLGLFL
jgi:YggT family protein